MKHAVALFVALFSMVFLMGDSCDSGDFTTSYFCCGTTGSCTSIATSCPASDCNTGLQTFQNGQNECSILQTDAANNNCALYNRFAEYINIGCTGTFTENPPLGAPVLSVQSTGVQSITLSWVDPPGVSGPIVYTILVGNTTGAEGFLTTNVSGNTYQATGLATGIPFYFIVAANLTFAGNLAAPGVNSNEVSATPQ